MKIRNTRDLRNAVRNPYAWPGGYPIYLTMQDGEMLCHDCVKVEYRSISAALRDPDPRHNPWRPLYAAALWENPEGAHTCAHCNTTLEPAYQTETVGEPT